MNRASGPVETPLSGIPRGLLVVLATIPLLPATLAAQPYGLDTRPAATPYLQMPQTPPQPSGSFITELAFPNLTFQNPVFMTIAPRSNQFYVCEREGRIWSFQNDPGTSLKTLVLDVSNTTQGWDDCGLLGMAFHPEFGDPLSPNRGHFYILHQYSTSPVPGPNRPPAATPAFNRLARYTIPDGSFVADPASELILINQHDRHVWHNGGAMFFHPVDGFLYFTIGDEGGANDTYDVAQKIDDKFFSGVFRIDVDMRGGSISHPIRRQPRSYTDRPAYSQNYYIPDDNPWQDPGGSVLEEFWAHGVRSPHRMTHDAVNDLILLGDVGQGTWEEIDIIERGGNYQWPYMEGTHTGARSPPSTLIGVEKPPIYDYRHGSGFPFEGNCVVGGYIYHGAEHAADLAGKYIFGDNTRGRIWAMDLSTSPATVEYLCNMPSGSNYTGLSSFGVDSDGEIYMCKMNHTGTGAIYKLGRADTTGAPIPPLLSQTGAFSDVVTLTPAPDLIPYDVASPLWSDAAIKTRWMSVPYTGASPPADEQIGFAPTGEWEFPGGTVFVKHFELIVDQVQGTRRRLETRLLVRQPGGGVYGVTYVWRPDESDADLLTDGLDEEITVTTATGTSTQTWRYPSSQECLTCHNGAANFVLGVKTRQLNCDLTYPRTGVTDNQIRALNHAGLFDPAVIESEIPGYDRLVPVTDGSATLEHRVRSYLDANCALCHRPGHVQAFFDARYDTPLASQGLVDGPVGNPLGIDGAVVIKPKDIWRSVLHVRDGSPDPTIRMPPLAKDLIDPEAMAALTDWINSLPGTPVLAPPSIDPPGGQHGIGVVVSITHDDPVASVHYTTDGTEPTTLSALYTAPFSLNQSATVKARAFRSGFAESITSSADLTVIDFRDPENPPVVDVGIYAEEFLGAWSALPNFDALAPDDSGVRSNFDISPRLQNDNFAFRFRGYLDIPEDGVYTFFTNSDDGSQLLVGDTLVVDNDGLHAPAETSGDIALRAGLHSVTVTMFERTGGEVLEVLYAGPGTGRTLVPDSMLLQDVVISDPCAVDTVPPDVNCPAPQSTVVASCQAPVPDMTGAVTATDNCTATVDLVMSQTPLAGTMVQPGDHTITVFVTDGAGMTASCDVPWAVEDRGFLRGNINNRAAGSIDIADVVDLVSFLFQGFVPAFDCEAALDVNDDGKHSIVDVIALVQGAFGLNGYLIPPPNADEPGGPGVVVPDGGAIPSTLGCVEGESCP